MQDPSTPSPPRQKISIYHDSSTYDFTLLGSNITHITKTMGNSSLTRDVSYDRLPSAVKQKFLAHIDEESSE